MTDKRQAYLLDMYHRALKRDRNAPPPGGLDKGTAAVARALANHVRLPQPSADAMERLQATILGRRSVTQPSGECRCRILRNLGLRCQSCPGYRAGLYRSDLEAEGSLSVGAGLRSKDSRQQEQRGVRDEAEVSYAVQGDGVAEVRHNGRPSFKLPTGMPPPDFD